MIEIIREWTINIVTLVLIIVLLEILVPTGKIKKFVDLVSGFILLIAIISPIIATFNKGINFNEYQLVSSNFLDKKSIEADSKILNEKQMQQITKSYRDKIIRQVVDNTKKVNGVNDVKADIIINEDYNSKDFGQIYRIYLSLKTVSDNSEVKPVTNIEKVKVKVGDNKKINEKSPVNQKLQSLRNEVESKIAELLQVSKENIVITIEES